MQHFRVEFEGKGKLLEVAQSEIIAKKTCPHYGTGRVYKRGTQSGVQMYKCVACTKWFSSTTGTPFWGIKKKDKWQSYLKGIYFYRIKSETEIQTGKIVIQ